MHGTPRIGLDAGRRQRGLRHVEAAEPGRIATALDEGAGEPDLVRPRPERIGADAQDHLGPVEARKRAQWTAEGEFGAALGIPVIDGLVHVPCGLRQGAQQPLDLACQRRRGDAAGDEMEAAPPHALDGRERPAQGPLEHVPGGDAVDPLGHRPRAVGIVEVEDRGFREQVGRAEAAGMQRIALDLDRPPVHRDGVHAAGPAAQRQGRRVARGNAGQKLLGGADIGHDLLDRPGAAAGSERDAGTEQPKRLAAGRRDQR